MNKGIIAFSILIVASIAPMLAPAQDVPDEIRLACRRSGRTVDGDDPLVARFGVLLRQLDSMWSNDGHTIAVALERAADELLAVGIDQDLLELTEGLSRICCFPPGSQDLVPLVRSYEQSRRETGRSHGEAIRQLRRRQVEAACRRTKERLARDSGTERTGN